MSSSNGGGGPGWRLRGASVGRGGGGGGGVGGLGATGGAAVALGGACRAMSSASSRKRPIGTFSWGRVYPFGMAASMMRRLFTLVSDAPAFQRCTTSPAGFTKKYTAIRHVKKISGVATA
jgi:hypothetical protein